MRFWGLLLGGLLAAACGHERVTGSAHNDWSTPTGWGSVAESQVRVSNPASAAHPARNKSAFRAEAPNLQPVAEPPITEPGPPPPVPPSDVTPMHDGLPSDTTLPPDVP
jgi:hypothetical protein